MKASLLGYQGWPQKLFVVFRNLNPNNCGLIPTKINPLRVRVNNMKIKRAYV